MNYYFDVSLIKKFY